MGKNLDGRHRDLNGEISRKHGNTTVAALRQIYGDDFASGYRGDAHLNTVLRDAHASSLRQYLKSGNK